MMFFFWELMHLAYSIFFYHQSYARALSYEFWCLDRIEDNFFIFGLLSENVSFLSTVT